MILYKCFCLALDLNSGSNHPLFSMSTFQEYIVPRLLHMFSVRDAQVRLLLLEHFENYCSAFSKEQLCSKVLPEVIPKNKFNVC